MCGPLLVLSPALNRWGPPPPDDRGYVANQPTFGPLLILSPTLKHWDPPNGRGYVATHLSATADCPCIKVLLICRIVGPLLILSPALKHLGPPRWQGICGKSTHFWPMLILSPALKQ